MFLPKSHSKKNVFFFLKTDVLLFFNSLPSSCEVFLSYAKPQKLKRN